MSSMNSHSGEIQNPGSYDVGAMIKGVCAVFVAIGALAFLLTLQSNPDRASTLR